MINREALLLTYSNSVKLLTEYGQHNPDHLVIGEFIEKCSRSHLRRLIADIVILANLTTVGVIAQKTSEGETHTVSEKHLRSRGDFRKRKKVAV